MSRTLILYGSTTGATERLARTLADLLDGDVDVASISGFDLERLKDYEYIILGTSTWGDGNLQDDWADALPALVRQDLSGKTVALFGLGDAEGYRDTFVDGLGELHAALAESGARRAGFWEVEGYAFGASKALEGGRFVGLVLDEDNQAALTDVRLRQWVKILQGA